MGAPDAKCCLEDVVATRRVAAFTREEFDEAGAEGGFQRLDEMGPRPEEGQASESGFTTCYHDVDEAALHARVSDVGRPLVCVQR